MKEIFPGVFEHRGRLYTKNLVPRVKVYGEELLREEGVEYRNWNPYRSKPAAAIKNGLRNFPLGGGSKILYLGAATGTTVSHFSDIAEKGEVYAVEISAHSMKKLLALCEKRENIIPIMADARNPKEYEEAGKVDVVYEDVAHPEQAEILLRNAAAFLKKGGWAFIAIKSQSIDVTKKPSEVYVEVGKELGGAFEIVERVRLEPYEREHLFLVLRKKE